MLSTKSILFLAATCSVGMAFPRNIPRQDPSSDAATVIGAEVAAALTAKWKVELEIGSTQFFVGDISDGTAFGQWIGGKCGDIGCDAGSPTNFTYNGIDSSGHLEQLSGEFVMHGNYPDTSMRDSMLDAIKAAVQNSISCSDQSYTDCDLKKREASPETPSVALGCDSGERTKQCNIVNYIQATVYSSDDSENMKAQITMDGTSENDSLFPCGEFIDAISGSLAELDVEGVDQSATAFSAICNAIEGN